MTSVKMSLTQQQAHVTTQAKIKPNYFAFFTFAAAVFTFS